MSFIENQASFFASALLIPAKAFVGITDQSNRYTSLLKLMSTVNMRLKVQLDNELPIPKQAIKVLTQDNFKVSYSKDSLENKKRFNS